jgi:hypothetical protein
MIDTEKPYTVRGVDETQQNLRKVYGIDRAELIWNSLNSAYDRLLFARHHLLLLRKTAPSAVNQGLQAFGFLSAFDSEDDVGALFSQSMHQIKMHVTDCIQHMHAIGDTVAFIVYFFVQVPEKKPLEKKDITLSSVRKLLKNSLVLPDENVFLKQLSKLADEKSYSYLADLNNHAKHRSIVKPAVNLSDGEVSEDEQTDLLIFPMVEINKPSASLQNCGAIPCHAQRPILPFIEAELARIWEIYGQIRREVEDQVRADSLSGTYSSTAGA